MEATEHLGFILAAYGLTGLVVLGLVGWTVGDYLSARRALAALEKSGLGRRRFGD
jgi:heme exporter protein CcmD